VENKNGNKHTAMLSFIVTASLLVNRDGVRKSSDEGGERGDGKESNLGEHF
jgi:hypothetical protein